LRYYGTANILTLPDYLDPDGNQVETSVPVFKTAEEATAYMQGPDFSQNNIGIDFVPEEMEKRLAAGESVQKVMDRNAIGKV
jgi:hypothetical protein